MKLVLVLLLTNCLYLIFWIYLSFISEAYQQTVDDGSTLTAQPVGLRVLEKKKFGQLQHSKQRPTSLGERQERLEAES